MRFNAKKLADKIEDSAKSVKACGFIENEMFAIFEDEDIQIQVRVTKNEDQFCDTVQDIECDLN